MIEQDALPVGMDQISKRQSSLNRIRSAMFFASDLVSNSHEEAMKLVTPEIHVDADSDLANSDLHRILERADDFLNSGRNHFAISLLSRVVHLWPIATT